MNFYLANDYKELLTSVLEERRRSHGREFSYQRMAEYCGVQKTYLSKVLNRKGRLSADQVFLACEFLRLNNEERNFIMLLYDKANSQVPARLKEIESALDRIRSEQTRTRNAHPTAFTVVPQSNQFARYHLNPAYQLVHMCLTINKFARSPELISQKLNIPRERLNGILEDLKSLELIAIKDGEVKILKDQIHLSSDNDLYPAYRTLLRMKASERLHSSPRVDDFGYSTVFSADGGTRDRIRQDFVVWLKRIQAQVVQSRSMDLFQLNFDLFTWCLISFITSSVAHLFHLHSHRS